MNNFIPCKFNKMVNTVTDIIYKKKYKINRRKEKAR